MIQARSRQIFPTVLLLISGLALDFASSLLLLPPPTTAIIPLRTTTATTTTTTNARCRTTTILYSSTNNNKQDTTNNIESNELPANLKRKVDAKRPPLGHVIPKATKDRKKRRGGGEEGGSRNPKLRPQGKAREAGLNNPSLLKILGGTARGRRLDSPTVYLRPMMGKVREAVYSTFTSFGVYDFPVVRHLDLFAGSGSVGLESLSRGASHCTFCDLSPDCCSAIQRNIEWCQFGDDNNSETQKRSKSSSSSSRSQQDISGSSTRVVCADVLQVLRDPVSVGIPIEHAETGIVGETYDLVTICPPYEEVVYADLMEAAASSPLVKEDTIILVEYPVELWGDIPHVYTSRKSSSSSTGGGGDNDDMARTLVGIRNRKYGRTVIAMYICNPTGKVQNAESRPEEFI